MSNEIAIIEEKKKAWGELAVAVYHTELQLQAMAQKAISELPVPTKIEDIPQAEEALKSAGVTMRDIEARRKEITNKFRDVADRLMIPEKSFAEPIKTLTNAIIELKKQNEAIEANKAKKAEEIRLLKERIIKHCADLDAKMATFMNELMDKAFVFALDMDITIAEIGKNVDEWSDVGIKKILEYKFEAVKLDPVNITLEEAQAISKESFTFSLYDYANRFDYLIKEKFKDYETAFLNKKDALKRNAEQAQINAKNIADQKLNAEISASINANVVDAVVGVETKALKKVYEVDMPETVDTALALMGCFAANKNLLMSKMRITKWFAFSAGNIATALSKVKSEDNLFQPSGIKFKEVAKL